MSDVDLLRDPVSDTATRLYQTDIKLSRAAESPTGLGDLTKQQAPSRSTGDGPGEGDLYPIFFVSG